MEGNRKNGTQPLRENDIKQKVVVFNDVCFQSANGVEYCIPADGFINHGGEAYVYRAVRSGDGETFAAKIYDQVSVNPDTLYAHKQICTVLERVSDASYKHHLMPLLDYGTVNIQIDPNTFASYFVDIHPLLPNLRSLADYHEPISPEALRETYLPQLVDAVETLHSNGIVHRDIKPENIVVLENNAQEAPMVVLSDFGIAGLMSIQDPDAVIRTTQSRGTIGYRAPEVTNTSVLFASDLFSIGCTIGALLNGGYFFPEHQEAENPFEIDQGLSACIRDKVWPFKIARSPLEQKLLQLFLGLIQHNPEYRFTLKDIRDFCRDGAEWNPPVNQQALAQMHVGYTIRINGTECHSLTDIARVLETPESLEKAKVLINSDILYKQLSNKGEVEPAEFVYKLRHPRPDQIKNADDETVARLLHYLDPGVHICISGKRFSNLQELCNQSTRNDEKVHEVIRNLLDKKYLFWKFNDLFKRTQNENFKAVADKLKTIEELFERESTKQTAFYLLLYTFADIDQLKEAKLLEADYNPSAAIDWDAYFVQNIFENGSTCTVAETFLHFPERMAWLKFMGLPIETLLEHVFHSSTERITALFKLFEIVAPTTVRKIYMYYGPYAYLTWVKQNLSMYHFSQKYANLHHQWQDNIYALQDPSGSPKSIDEQVVCFTKLLTLYSELQHGFDNNLLAAYLGLNSAEQETHITSNHSQAFFTEIFMNQPVPNGFIISLDESFDSK